MPESCLDTRGDLPFFQPGVRPTTSGARLLKGLMLVLSMGWLAIPVVDLVTAHAGAARTVGALAAFAAWLAVYIAGIVGPRRLSTRETLVWAGALSAIAAALTVADRPSWGTLYVYCAIAGAMTLDPARYAIRWVLGITALCGVTLLISHDPDGTLVSLTATTLALGFLMFSFGRLDPRQPRAARGARGARRTRRRSGGSALCARPA